MKLVQYLYKKFIPLFIGALAFFSLVLVLVELLMNLWSFISNQVPGMAVAHLMLLYVPKTIWYAAPLAILFAVSYTLSDLYANNELVAVFASGIPLINFTMPLLVFSFLLSFGMFFFEDRVVVPTYAKKVEQQQSVLKTEKSKNNDKIVVIGESGNVVYKADYYDDAAKRLYSVYIIFRNDDKTFSAIIRADSALWNENKWRLAGAVQYTYKNGTLLTGSPDSKLTNRLVEPPETFRNNTI